MTGSICFIGEPVRDMRIPLTAWPLPGDKATFNSISYAPGGAVANSAQAARALGAEVSLVGAAKDSTTTRELIAGMESDGIDVTGIELGSSGADPVCLVFILPDSNVVMYPDRSEEHYRLSARALGKIAEAAVVVSTPERLERIENSDELLDAITTCKERGGVALFDLDNGLESDRSMPLLATADFVVVNEYGASRLFETHRDGTGWNLPDWLAEATAIVTLGDKGAWAQVGVDGFHVQGTPVDAVDATGAGDAFVGGLAYALGQDWAVPEAVALAGRMGALAVTIDGTRITSVPTWVPG